MCCAKLAKLVTSWTERQHGENCVLCNLIKPINSGSSLRANEKNQWAIIWENLSKFNKIFLVMWTSCSVSVFCLKHAFAFLLDITKINSKKKKKKSELELWAQTQVSSWNELIPDELDSTCESNVASYKLCNNWELILTL